MNNPPILLNLNFYTKGRNVRWIEKHGDSAPIILQAVWIESSQEKNGKMLKEDAYAIPFLRRYAREKIIEVLESAVLVGLLDVDGEYYFNSQTVENLKAFKLKHNNYKKGHEKRKRNQNEFKMNSQRNQTKSKLDFIDTDTDSETDNDLDLNKLEITLREFQKPEIIQAIKSWKAHRRSLGCQFDQVALDSMLLLYRCRVDQLSDDIHHSITNRWKTLNEKPRHQARAGPQKKSTKETLQELYQQALVEESNAKN